ncbi:hypothetical protein CHU98_g5943 [Xylaria longipes]|nr:hypothetical protein CHU98_g5943 [Xylaria longipes]
MSLDQLHSLPPEEQMVILNGPALGPPPGVMSSLDHPPNDNTAFTVTYIGFAYRLYRGVGFFVHQWDVRVKDLSEILHVIHLASNLYAAAIMALKIAILLEWARTFSPPGTNRTFHNLCHILIWTTALFYSTYFIAENLSCTPHDAIWDKTIPAKCFDHKALDVASAVINIVSHLFIFALPQLVIWRLNMRKETKVGISLMFAVGILTVVAGGFRLGTTVQYFLSPDTTYRISAVALWATAELTLVTLVFCLPAFPSVFRDSKLTSKLPIFHSWAIHTLTKLSGVGKSSVSGGTSNRQSTSTNSYRKIDDTATVLKNLGSHRGGERSVSAFRSSSPSHDTAPNGSIVVITHFEREEEVRRSGV